MNRSLLPIVAAACLSAPLGAQTLTSVEPNRLYQVDPSAVSSRRTFHLVGNGITPGANVGEMLTRMHVELRRGGGEWQTLGTAGGESTSNQLWREVFSKDWLATAGDLEIRVVVDGRPTNALPIHVLPAPVTPPRITIINPSTVRPGADYHFRIGVANFSDPYEFTVAGQSPNANLLSVEGGFIDTYLPESIRNRPGRYPVVVKTRAGASLPAYIDVLGVPRVVSVTPGEVIKEKAGDAANVRAKVVFDGSMPSSARVGNDSIGWVTTTALENADSPTAVWVDVPMAMIQTASLGRPQTIHIVLGNEAGTSAGTLVARSDASNLRTQRPAGTVTRPGVARPAIVRPPVTRPPAP